MTTLTARLDRTFRISLILKVLDGALELIGGVLLLLVSPARMNEVVRVLTQHELSEDPHDFIATRLVALTQALTGSVILFASIYLRAQGLVKVVLVVSVLREQLWAYPWMIGFLLLFITCQTYQIVLARSAGLIALTLSTCSLFG